MKKILKISLVVGVVLVALNVYGVVKSPFSKKDVQKKTVTFDLLNQNNIDLSVYDANNKLMHTENISSNGQSVRTYNLKTFAEGVYYLVEESDSKITKYEIVVADDKATIMSNPYSEVSK